MQRKTGKFPNLTVKSVDVFDGLRLCREQDFDGLTDYLMRAIGVLVKGGANFVALSANTPHIVFDRLRAQCAVPMVSIVEAARDEAVRLHLRRVGLLGTIFTMTADCFKAPFTADGIDVVTPVGEDAAYVGRKISEELELGVVNEDTLRPVWTRCGSMSGVWSIGS